MSRTQKSLVLAVTALLVSAAVTMTGQPTHPSQNTAPAAPTRHKPGGHITHMFEGLDHDGTPYTAVVVTGDVNACEFNSLAFEILSHTPSDLGSRRVRLIRLSEPGWTCDIGKTSVYGGAFADTPQGREK